MKERPIIFSSPMVRAILENRKTQTRRVIKPIGKDDGFVIVENENGLWPYRSDDGESMFHTVKENRKEYLYETPHSCPYGNPGDRLWVRETFLPRARGKAALYRADYDECEAAGLAGMYSDKGWKPSIFMPRELSRITLEIINIRVERLQEISEEDSIAEGVRTIDVAAKEGATWCDRPRRAYRFLWNSINGKGSWDMNPWVFVISFRRI